MISAIRNLPAALSLAVVVALTGCGQYDSPEANAAAPESSAADETTTTAQLTGNLNAEAPPSSPPARENPAPVREGPTKIAAAEPNPASAQAPSTLTIEPARLDLGTIAANKYATGTVKITNSGAEPITVQQCKTSCGCTSTNCPKGEALQPGESRDVDIRLTAGSRERPMNKTVTFIVEGQKPVTLPVKLQVVEYVTIDPPTIDPEKVPDGRIVIRAKDEEPFRVVSVNPPVIESFGDEPKIEHEVFVPWDTWRELGQGRRLIFRLDHPQADQVSTLVRTARRVNRKPTDTSVTPDTRNLIQDTRENLRDQGVVDAPLDFVDAERKLDIAVKYGDVGAVNEALEGELSDSVRNDLLAKAARYGRVEIMAALLEAGADINTKDRRGRTPLITAVQSRNAEAIKLLVGHGADVNAKDTVEGTALLRAAGFGDAAMTGALIAAGADVNAADKNGQTPLMWAARWGDAKRVEALLAAGANATARDKQGLTAADYARNRGEAGEPIVEKLQGNESGD